MKGRTLLLVAIVLGGVLSADVGAGRDRTGGGTANWRTVSASTNHACGIRTTGRLYCWGHDNNYQLGNGAPQRDAAAPVQVEA